MRGADPGTLHWSGIEGRCRGAIVLCPDRPLEAGVVVDLGLLALFDALAVLAPPQVPMHIQPPDGVSVDGGRVAGVRATLGAGRVPDWAVLGIDISVDSRRVAPGETPDETCLAEEGLGDVTSAEIVMHFCRHLMGWVDAWHEEGAPALARAVGERLPRWSAA